MCLLGFLTGVWMRGYVQSKEDSKRPASPWPWCLVTEAASLVLSVLLTGVGEYLLLLSPWGGALWVL